tara:strand:- start:289 stop:636 length:348 start_codon:yes stop_codon:yes gene_type:complete
MIIDIEPMSKPRMVYSDRWRKRKCVLDYWAYKDELSLKAAGFELGPDLEITFYLSMPKSWSKKKKSLLEGEPHMQTPDLDNLIKAFMDCVSENDAHVHTINAEKIWAYEGRIDVQ